MLRFDLRPLAAALVIGFGVGLGLPAHGELPPPVEREQRHEVAGSFRSVAEFLQLADGAGRPTGELFAVSYLGASDGPRPVTFAFNGGPGAASAYLHVGAMGPQVLATEESGRPATPPRLVPNPDSWLAFTDLVFLDPIGTGFSRPAARLEDPRRAFYGTTADLDSLAQAIRLWLDRHGRWGDPLFLAGESYGGFRAAALAARLPRDAGIAVAGAVLVSPVIDFQTVRRDGINPLPWITLLPSLVASAEALGRIEGEPPDREEVEAFALGAYAEALLRPERLEEVLPTLARWTGLEADWIRARRGRIAPGEYRRALLRSEGTLLSAYDGAYAAPDPDPIGPGARFDAVLDGLTGPITTAYVGYLRNTLGVEHEGSYRLLNRDVARRWSFGREGGQGYLSALDALQEALVLNPELRLLVAHGATDLVTPYFASTWLLGQLEASLPSARGRLETLLVPGGHMMYMRPASRARLTEAAAALYAPTG